MPTTTTNSPSSSRSHVSAAAAFVARYYDFVRRLAFRLASKNRSVEPEDVLQDALEALLVAVQRDAAHILGLERPEGYVATVVRHAAHRAHGRHRRAVVRPTEVTEAPELLHADRFGCPEEQMVARHESAVRVGLVKRRLAPRDAEIFSLLVLERRSIREVADALNVSANSVYQSRFRILERSRDLLATANDAAFAAAA